VTPRDGKVLVNCRAACSQEEVLAALSELGLWWPVGPETAEGQARRRLTLPKSKPLPEEAETKPADYPAFWVGVPTQTYPYTRPDGTVSWTKYRQDRDGHKNVWMDRGRVNPYPIYGEQFAVPGAANYVIVEGEPKVDAVYIAQASHKGKPILALTLGSTSDHNQANSMVLARRLLELKPASVWLWPDHDQPGHKAMGVVATALAHVRLPYQMVDPAELGLGPAEDVIDHLNRGGSLSAVIEQPATANAIASIGIRASDVEIEGMIWLWKHRLALGMLAGLDGDPEEGKSLFVADCAFHVTTGSPWPGGSPCPKGGVIWVGAEDSFKQITVPRLMAAGADCSKVRLVGTLPGGRLLSLPEDVAVLEQLIEQDQALLLAFDPIMPYISKELSANTDKDVRQALTPLAEVLDRTGCAGLMLRHFNKNDRVAVALYRGLGSIAFNALSRTAMGVGRDKEEPGARVLAMTKSNIGPKPKARRYRIEEATVGTDPKTGAPITTGHLVWGDETEHEANAMFTAFGQVGQEKAAGRDLLLNLLAGGREVLVRDVFAAFNRADLTKKSAYYWKDKLGVQDRRQGFQGPSVWWLEDSAIDDVGRVTGSMAEAQSSSTDFRGSMGDVWKETGSMASIHPVGRTVGDTGSLDGSASRDRCPRCRRVDYKPLEGGRRHCRLCNKVWKPS
jgi:hypothetical protein